MQSLPYMRVATSVMNAHRTAASQFGWEKSGVTSTKMEINPSLPSSKMGTSRHQIAQ
jgi:hypothetical protein